MASASSASPAVRKRNRHEPPSDDDDSKAASAPAAALGHPVAAPLEKIKKASLAIVLAEADRVCKSYAHTLRQVLDKLKRSRRGLHRLMEHKQRDTVPKSLRSKIKFQTDAKTDGELQELLKQQQRQLTDKLIQCRQHEVQQAEAKLTDAAIVHALRPRLRPLAQALRNREALSGMDAHSIPDEATVEHALDAKIAECIEQFREHQVRQAVQWQLQAQREQERAVERKLAADQALTMDREETIQELVNVSVQRELTRLGLTRRSAKSASSANATANPRPRREQKRSANRTTAATATAMTKQKRRGQSGDNFSTRTANRTRRSSGNVRGPGRGSYATRARARGRGRGRGRPRPRPRPRQPDSGRDSNSGSSSGPGPNRTRTRGRGRVISRN